MYTVELSLFVVDQCLWISWAAFTHEITSSSTFNKLIYGLAFNATNQCPRKLRLHESATFWQSKNIDPTNKNNSTVIIRNVTGMNFLHFISFTLFEWGKCTVRIIQKAQAYPGPLQMSNHWIAGLGNCRTINAMHSSILSIQYDDG